MFAESLTYEEKIKYMRFAIYSSCFGAVIQRTLSESSVFIVYASALGAGKFLSLVTTALIPIMTLILLVPVAYSMEKYGIKKILIPAYWVGFSGLLLASLAGSISSNIQPGLFSIGVFIYAASIGFHSAGWFPLQRFIVPKKERGNYFGRMRYSWQIAVGLFLLLSSLIIWNTASIKRLQIIIVIGALLSIGRILNIAKIPEKTLNATIAPLKTRFMEAVKDSRLMRYSLYGFGLNLLISSTVPLGFGFVKYALNIPQHLTILLSVITNVSAISGYILGSRVIDKNHSGKLFLLVQILFALVNFLFLFCTSDTTFSIVFATILSSLAGAFFAFSSVVASAKMFGMVKEENINISLAICFGLYNGGKGLSRVFSSFLIGVLPESIKILGGTWTSFHLLFFLFGSLLFIATAVQLIKKNMVSEFWN